MDHQAAIDTQAAERYMLAEMSETERDQFEEHYFGCSRCADDVRALEAIREGARAAAAPAVTQRHRSRLQIVPWAAAASLLLVVGYQNLVHIPRLAERAAPAMEVARQEVGLTSETRAEGDGQRLRANEAAIVAVDVVHDPQYASYRYELRRAGGSVIASGPIAATQVQTASVPLIVRPLSAGIYDVLIEGVRKDGNRSPVTRHSLVVEERSSAFEDAP